MRENGEAPSRSVLTIGKFIVQQKTCASSPLPAQRGEGSPRPSHRAQGGRGSAAPRGVLRFLQRLIRTILIRRRRIIHIRCRQPDDDGRRAAGRGTLDGVVAVPAARSRIDPVLNLVLQSMREIEEPGLVFSATGSRRNDSFIDDGHDIPAPHVSACHTCIGHSAGLTRHRIHRGAHCRPCRSSQHTLCHTSAALW